MKIDNDSGGFIDSIKADVHEYPDFYNLFGNVQIINKEAAKEYEEIAKSEINVMLF